MHPLLYPLNIYIPVNRAYIKLGFSFNNISGPRPSFSITPGLKGSINTSAFKHNFLATSLPRKSCKSMATDLFPRARRSATKANFTLSMRVTTAPKSASIIPAKGTGARPANSITRRPAKAAILDIESLQNVAHRQPNNQPCKGRSRDAIRLCFEGQSREKRRDESFQARAKEPLENCRRAFSPVTVPGSSRMRFV